MHGVTTMARGERRLFIYYRVDAVGADDAIAAAARLQAELCAAHPGLRAALLRRATDAETDPRHVTLMETYTLAAAPGVSAELQAAIEARAKAALGPRIVGARHVEVFEPCAW